MSFYVPRHFRVEDREALERFVAAHAFATLVCAGASGLSVSHIPFLPVRGDDGRLRLLGHVARANPHWQELEAAAEVLVIFPGPHAYVSPGWYAASPSVPTWNYAVVHARGKARLLPQTELATLLDRLSQAHEAGLPDPWSMDKLPGEYGAKMMAATVGFEIAVDTLEGKFKLSQNRSRADVEGVVQALQARGESEMAALMLSHADRADDSR